MTLTRNVFLLVVAACGLASSSSGCKWLDRNRAEYHEQRAGDEAAKLNFGKAIDEAGKASDARKDVKKDPFP